MSPLARGPTLVAEELEIDVNDVVERAKCVPRRNLVGRTSAGRDRLEALRLVRQLALDPIDALAKPKHVIEGAVLQHENDEVFHVFQSHRAFSRAEGAICACCRRPGT